MNANRSWLLGVVAVAAILAWHLSPTTPSPPPAVTETPYRAPRRPIVADTEFYKASTLPGYAEVLKLEPPQEYAGTGKTLFLRNCASCHGETGKGDGPGYLHMNPRMRDFGQPSSYWFGPGELGLFRTVKFGIPNSGMAPWKGRMTDHQIWETVHYLRSLQTDI